MSDDNYWRRFWCRIGFTIVVLAGFTLAPFSFENGSWNKAYAKEIQAKRKIFEYIEVFYNRERIHSVLDFKSPIEYELNVA